METTIAFVLGMSVAVVIGLAVVAVIGFVKAIKTEKALNEQMKEVYLEIDNRITNIERMLNEMIVQLNRRIDETQREEELERDKLIRNYIEGDEFLHKRMDEISSQIDSRFDKAVEYSKSNTRNLENYLENLIKKLEEKVNNKIILKD